MHVCIGAYLVLVTHCELHHRTSIPIDDKGAPDTALFKIGSPVIVFGILKGCNIQGFFGWRYPGILFVRILISVPVGRTYPHTVFFLLSRLQFHDATGHRHPQYCHTNQNIPFHVFSPKGNDNCRGKFIKTEKPFRHSSLFAVFMYLRT